MPPQKYHKKRIIGMINIHIFYEQKKSHFIQRSKTEVSSLGE